MVRKNNNSCQKLTVGVRSIEIKKQVAIIEGKDVSKLSKMAGKIADTLCQKELIQECDKEIYEFGYEVLIENTGKTFLLLMAGGIFHQFIITLVFILAFTTLRSCCGGYHASKSWKCDVITIILWGFVVAGTVLFEPIVRERQVLLLLIAIVSELVIYQYAPVEHIHKQLTEEKKARNRRNALVLGLVYGIFILLLSFTWMKLSVALSLTVLEVVILMIIPKEGRSFDEEADCFR